jgi:hypothetical protein
MRKRGIKRAGRHYKFVWHQNGDVMNLKTNLFQSIMVLAIIAGTNGPAFSETSELPMNCQVIVSLMELDEDAPGLEEDSYDITFYGAAAQKPFNKELLEYGLEAGVNLCMENDNNVLHASAGSSGGSVRVAIDNELFLLDYFMGGYVAVNPAKRLRLYAGAGPLLIYGSWEHEPDENDDDLNDETESQLSAGVYGRAGIEVGISQKISVGAGIRAMTTGLEFNDSAGDVKVEGSQVFFNLSFRI